MARKDIKAGSIYFDILVKTEKIQKEIADAKETVKKEAKKIERSLEDIQKQSDKTARKLGDIGRGKAKRGFDGINLSVKELKLRLVDLNAKMQRLSATTGLSVESLARVGGGRTRKAFESIKREIESTKLQINKLTAASTNAAKHMHSSGNKIKNMFKMMAIRMAAFYVVLRGARAALNFTKEAKNAARDALETQTKFEQVFSSIREEAELTAQSLAKSFGLANTTARELLGNTGDLLVGFGFTEKKSLELANKMVKLAGDLASFKNISGGVPKVLNLMISAMSGITQASKPVGVVISQRDKDFMKLVSTLQKTKGMTFQQARALAVLNEFFKQSKVSVGDYQRTKDNLANTERRLNEEFLQLKITLGQKLNPAFLGVTRAALGFLRTLTESKMDEAIRRLGELGEKSEDLKKLFTLRTKVENLKELQKLKSELKGMKDISNIPKLFKVGLKDFSKFNKALTLFNLKDLEAQKTSVEALGKDLASLLERQIRLQSLGEDTKGLEALIRLRTLEYDVFGGIIERKERIKELEADINKKPKKTVKKDPNKIAIVSADKLIKRIELQRTLRELNNTITNEFVDNAKNEIIALLKGNVKIEDRIKLLQELQKLNKEFSKAEDYIFATGGNLLKSPKGAPEGLTTGEKIIAARGKTDYGDLGKGMKEVTGDIEELNNVLLSTQDLTSMIRGGFEEAGRTIAQAFGNAITLFKNANSVLQQFLNTLVKAVGQMLIMAAIKFGLSFITGGVSSGAGVAAKGGNFVGTSSGVKKMASGGSFVVPPGFPNDTFPLMVQSGEHISVIPAGQSNTNIADLRQEIISMKKTLNNSIQNMNLSIMTNNKPTQVILVTSDPTARVKIDNETQNRLRRGNIQSGF